jgi:hypothetical protein
MPRWKPSEESYLRDHAAEGAQAVAEALGRTVSSVQTQASRMGISLYKRWRCPKCGRYSYRPLTKWSGWCRKCSIEASADTAALKNRQIRKEIAEEKEAIRKEERRRQMIYSDTDRQKRERKKMRRNRESCKGNAKSKGKPHE